MSDPKVFDEIPSFLEPSGDTPNQPIKRVLTDLKNIGQAFREGHDSEFRSTEGLKRQAKEILGSLMGERSDEVRQQVQNLAEQALGEVKSNNLEQAGGTIIDLLNASPKIREVEGNTMDAEQLLDEDEADVSEFLDVERDFSRGNLLYDKFSAIASDAGSGITLGSVEADVSRDMFWVNANFKNVEDESDVSSVASALARELDLAEDFVYRYLKNNRSLNANELNVTLQLGFEKFLDRAKL